MAGTFSKSSRPKRPGAYFNFTATEQEPVLRNTLGTVVIPFTHSWGPSETVVELGEFGDFLSVFGQGGTTPPAYSEGYKAVVQAFQGEGIPGGGGAGAVLAYRITGSAAAKSTKSLSNGATNAITLTAKYEGTFGDTLRLTVESDATSPGTIDNLVVLQGSIELERFKYAKTNITDLGAQVNASSGWVAASAITSGTGLTQIAGTALTGGNDGTTVSAGDWTAFMSAIEPFRFSVIAPANLTDSTVLASMVTWGKTLQTRGKRFVTVVGGGTVGVPDTVALAVTRSATINDPNFINVGGGIYTDSRLGDLTPAQLAPRVAGILAARGERQSITFARLAGLNIKVGPTESEILIALAGGVVTFARDSHPTAPVRLEKGLTTYTTTTDVTRPFSVYSVPKFVRTMHAIEVELTEFAEQNVIGRLPVNPATRAYVVGQVQSRLAGRELDGIIQPDWVVRVDTDPPPTERDDFIGLVYGLKFGRTIEQVFNTVVVG